jgi:hypothetical protein
VEHEPESFSPSENSRSNFEQAKAAATAPTSNEAIVA